MEVVAQFLGFAGLKERLSGGVPCSAHWSWLSLPNMNNQLGYDRATEAQLWRCSCEWKPSSSKGEWQEQGSPPPYLPVADIGDPPR